MLGSLIKQYNRAIKIFNRLTKAFRGDLQKSLLRAVCLIPIQI